MAITVQPPNPSSIAATLALALLSAMAPLRAGTLTVTSGGDGGGTCSGAACTLRQAPATANPGDTISFGPGVATIYVLTGALNVTKNVTVSGPGANLLT